MNQEIKRAKYLVLNGRFQNRVTKVTTRYEKLNSDETITIGGQKYMPYYDKVGKQVVYAYEDKQTLYALTFSNADYTFGHGDAFEWFDA